MARTYAAALAVLLVGKVCFAGVYYPTQYGANSNGVTLSTTGIQKAVQAAADAGGGTVELTKGTYLSGTIFFRSNVTLQLDSGATLLGSTNPSDYPR